MYSEFKWWQGVVEDRNDPLKLGRCRVRVLGYHTDKLNDIPTKSLPWATPMQPITSAAMNGIGTTPMGPVEGTWVFGFWRDGSNAQEPVIIGTVGGKTEADHKKDSSRGFNDPDGIYPRDEFIGEADTNRLARGIGKPVVGSMNGENAQSLVNKRGSRNRGDPQAGSGVTNTGIPMGVAGNLWDPKTASNPEGSDRGTIEDTADGNVKVSGSYEGDANHYKNDYWNEPNPRYGGTADSDTEYLSSVVNTSQYPHNHVRMSEGGHVEEWDDSTSAERLHRYHRKGTFEEIQPDGTRVVKVVGSDYEIVAGSQNVYIKGICNLTINGDCRTLYRGDLVQEVVGDYHLHVGGEMRTKIFGNDAKEVMTNRKITINGEDDLFVAKNQIINIADNKTIIVGGNQKETIKKNVEETYGEGEVPGDHSTQTAGKYSYKSIDSMTLTAFEDFRISTDKNMFISVTLDSTQTILGDSEILVTGDQYENIGGDDTREVAGDFIEATGGTHASDAGGNMTKTAPNIYLN
jgi:hypothetical protein